MKRFALAICFCGCVLATYTVAAWFDRNDIPMSSEAAQDCKSGGGCVVVTRKGLTEYKKALLSTCGTPT